MVMNYMQAKAVAIFSLVIFRCRNMEGLEKKMEKLGFKA